MHSLTETIQQNVISALKEDLGQGDITAQLIPEDTLATAVVITREQTVMAGQAWFDAVFEKLDSQIEVQWHVAEGDAIAAETPLCTVTGNARHILSGERTGLNFLQTLCATAQQVKMFVDAVKHTQAIILDTRKTLPGLRDAQKYAVTCGGGQNHRKGLYDGILIKENHIVAAGSIANAVKAAQALNSQIAIEVEVENLSELQQALDAGADIVLLDNMSIQMLTDAVAMNKGRAKLEASGGVNLNTVQHIAETGVDYISVGSITKDIRATDLSMRFKLD